MSRPNRIQHVQAYRYLILLLTVGMSVDELGLEKQTVLPLKAGPGEFTSQTGPSALDLREH